MALAPGDNKVKAGRWTLKADRKGFKPSESAVTVEEGKSVSKTVDLVKKLVATEKIVLLDGTTIQDTNNSNYSYFNDAKYNKLMKAAARLTGQARYTAYGNLDIDIMKNAAPWIPGFNYTSRDFVSARTGNFIFHPVYGHPIFNALAIKK